MKAAPLPRQNFFRMADEPNWNLNFVDFDDNSKSRFIDVSKDDVDKLIAEQENENTKRKTTYDLNIVLKYLREVRKEDRELEEIPPQELNLFLSEFIIAARTKKGEQYEPSSLRGILTSVDRYLTRREYGKRLFTDPEFTRLRDALKAKQKELKKDGRGNKPKATTALSDEEIDILFEKNVLGTSSPQSLLNTVWLNNIIHFGLRGCTEQRNLRWGDVVLETDSQGKEYLVHSERQTKSRQGDDPRNVRPVKPRMYENKEIPAERNPVNVYKLYRNKRPQSMLEPDAPFYLTVNHFKSSVQGQQRDCTWFKAQPMGVNKLNSILKDMCEVGGIPRKTNHAGRKTLVQKLQDNDVPPNQIIQITGHKNLQSINNYSGLRERQMESISNILSSTASTSREVSDVSQSFTLRSAHHLYATINFQQTHRPRQYMKTSCKRCFMAIQLVEGFSTSLWPHHKVQWAAPNLNLQRKSFAVCCALSQTVGAVRKIEP